jgi:predicted nucleotide-binding protein
MAKNSLPARNSTSPNRAKAFIIHGRDEAAKKAVETIVHSTGAEVIPFDAAPPNEDDLQQVLDMVVNGIQEADVVIALLTPDEQAALYDSATGTQVTDPIERDEASGWQPRPNVLVEIGIAVGLARHKTILVRMGPIRRISDIAGVLMINLDQQTGEEQLRRAVVKRIGSQAKAAAQGRSTSSIIVKRPRWEYYDELGQLEADLDGQLIYGTRRSLLDAIKIYLRQNRSPSSWDSTKLVDFCCERFDQFEDTETTNAVFWQFINYGLLTFKDILSDWDDQDMELWWVDLQDYVTLTSRARALFQKLVTMDTGSGASKVG